MQEVCLMLADQQLVTGASILIVGYMKHCEITQHHFYIAANLTLVAFATYQSVLLIVSDVLRDNIRSGWRLAWITTIFGCVLLLNFLIYNDNFLAYQHFGHSMDCLWRQLPEDFTGQETAYVVFGILMDVWSGYSIVLHLYPELHAVTPFRHIEQVVGHLMNQPTYLYRKVQRQVSRPYEILWLWKLIEWPTWLLFIVSFTLREISSSLYFELARIYLYLYQTTWAVSWARDNAASNGRDGLEDSWGFGQILSLRADTTDTADTEMYEEKLYAKNWFKLWMFLVLLLLFTVVVALSVTLENGVPVQWID
ncbi:hypothetical protein KJ359_000590 [Pestalotiopsis sp. 9143b]|nr:hypothetical protein KJ359_000590 [Pestalotiopsis sp. 9143b]